MGSLRSLTAPIRTVAGSARNLRPAPARRTRDQRLSLRRFASRPIRDRGGSAFVVTAIATSNTPASACGNQWRSPRLCAPVASGTAARGGVDRTKQRVPDPPVALSHRGLRAASPAGVSKPLDHRDGVTDDASRCVAERACDRPQLVPALPLLENDVAQGDVARPLE